ncbi:WD40 repeat-like protein [Ascodesmis nigricans]|uniref:WD40 repeat-like protein n=1 Tax=Ascodesmis nigricans TaxID=341454 RepID=A0A4S2MKD7_9PEZI|nr:WD40 repeat-like protein [Ascodesmis nigricans]
MSSMEQRKAEIAAKRQRLAEIKQRNVDRKSGVTRRGQDVHTPISSRVENTAEIDTLLDRLVGHASVYGSSRPGSVTGSIISEVKSPVTQSVPARPSAPSGITLQNISTAPVAVILDEPPAPVREIVTYSKEVQTSEAWTDENETNNVQVISESKEQEIREKIRNEILEEMKEVQAPADADRGEKHGFFARELSEEEKQAISASHEFLDFIERSSKIVERALDIEYDILADYGMDVNGDDEDETGRRLKEVVQFYDERWSKKRMISDIHFSYKFPELVLAAYTKNPAAPHDPDGLVQVWNVHSPSRAEYVFHAQSDVLTARFSPFHPSLIIGGAYSGQVLVWDTRAKSQPVHKTPLTGHGHTHPVYSIAVVGTQNANNIISCSTDGWVCAWSPDILQQPQEQLDLTCPQPAKTDDMAPTCLAFPQSDPTYFLVGTEEGAIYPCHRYDRASAKAGVDPQISYRGHAAPIMSLDFHPVRGPVDLGDLVLSTSLDWTVKLWRSRPPTSSTAVNTQPIMEFNRDDIVYDAKWSSTKPGMFGLVDGAGQVEVWDLTVDPEVPIAKTTPSSKTEQTYMMKSLNKIAWEHHEGKRLAVGGMSGTVSVFDVATESPRNEEWTNVKKLVSRAEEGATR